MIGFDVEKMLQTWNINLSGLADHYNAFCAINQHILEIFFYWRQTCISWWEWEQFAHRQLHKRQTWCSERDPMRSRPPPPPPWWGPPPNLKQACTSGNCMFWRFIHIWPFFPVVRWCWFTHPGGDQAATAFPFGELRHAPRQGWVLTAGNPDIICMC